ncbi:DUF2590 family protein, partial [Escherichia coli]|uniref:DUF2590 family protein n=1 Tax=Escherichia coli TaxID=562 RepID=UPI003B27C1F9
MCRIHPLPVLTSGWSCMHTDKPLYIDLLITGRDLTLNSASEPVLCNNRESIAQDCQHAIIESGLATRLLAEKSPT